MSKYDELHALFKTLDNQSQIYLEKYFKEAPDWLYDSIQIVNYPNNYTFIEQGSKIESITILIKGIVKGTDYPILGAMYDFMWFKSVQTFGALEYFSEEPVFNATLMTACPCTMLLIPMTVYIRWIQSDQNAMHIDACMTTKQLLYEIRRERVYIFMQGTERLTYFLILYYKQFAKNGICNIRLTRQEISDSTGLSIRTVNRSLTTLLENNCLRKSGNNLMIQREQYDNLREMLVDIL